MTGALYFPYIRVPQNDWFSRVLLYWDKASAIVPMNYWQHPEQLGPYMVELIQERLVEPVAPVAYVGQIDNFAANFATYVVEKHSERLNKKHAKDQWPRIHIEKLGDLASELERLGLARRADGFWYQIEPETADDFMAYLAGAISTSSNYDLVPVTDDRKFMSGFSADARQAEQRARSIILEGILVGPRADISAYNLRRFKERYGNELIAFRRRVEYEVDNLLAINDEESRTRRAKRLVSTLKEEIAEIESYLSQPQYGAIASFGSLCALGALGVTAVADALAQNHFGYAAGMLGLLALVHGTRRQPPTSSVAFAAVANQFNS